jgi:uncharacterized protein involved in exopolysaccharide biosynthesis
MSLHDKADIFPVLKYRDTIEVAESIPALLWRRRDRFLKVFASVAGVLALGLLSITPTYVATASLIIGEREPTINNASPAWIQKLGDPADLESQLIVIQSPALMQKVLRRPEALEAAKADCEASRGFFTRLFSRGLDCAALRPDNEKATEFIKSRYGVQAVGRSRILSVSYSSASPEIATVLANGLAQAYIADQRDIASQGRTSSVAGLRQEQQRLETELADLERKIQDVRSAKGLVRGATSALIAEQLTALSQQLAVAEAAEAESLALAREFGNGNSAKVMESLPVAQLKQQLAATTARRSSLAATLHPAHPTMRALAAAEDDTRRALVAETKAMAEAAQRTYETAKQKAATLREQVRVMKTQASDIAEAESQLAGLVRTADARRTAYLELSRRIGDLESESLIGTSRLVNAAARPTQPNFPKRLPVLAASVTIGLIMAFAACCSERIFR